MKYYYKSLILCCSVLCFFAQAQEQKAFFSAPDEISQSIISADEIPERLSSVSTTSEDSVNIEIMNLGITSYLKKPD